MKFKLVENINERWYDIGNSDSKIWWSDSPYELKNFLINLSRDNKSQGYRLLIGSDTYAVANALELDHEQMERILRAKMLDIGHEHYILGIPKISDFDQNNFEFDEYAYTKYQLFCKDPISREGKSFSNWIDDESLYGENGLDPDKIPQNMSKAEFIDFLREHENYNESVAIFDGFEVGFYAADHSEKAFKQTELYNILKSLYIDFKEG